MPNKSTSRFFLLLFVLSLFSCTQGTHNNELDSSVATGSIQTESLFDIIAKKQHQILAFPPSIDSYQLKRYSMQEVAELQFDQMGNEIAVEFYETNEAFLSEPLDSTDFLIYYTQLYGGEHLEKRLRIIDQDSLFEIPLAIVGGDDAQTTYTLVTQFIDDSTFIQIEVEEQTAKDNTHSMAHRVDSSITPIIHKLQNEPSKIKTWISQRST